MFNIKVISDLNDARKVWEDLSGNNNIYEDWNFRYLFYKYFAFPLRFYVGEENGQVIGLLPLQYNSEKNYLEFFGGGFMEDNHVFIKPGYEKFISEFYNSIKEKAMLEDIVADNEFAAMEFMENKYIVELDGLHSAEEYLKKTFSSKTRKSIKKRNEEVESLGLEISCNEPGDLDELIELNKRSFGKQSSFYKPFRREIYTDILNGPFKSFTMSAKANGKKENVSLGIIHKDIFASLAIGNNKDFQNLGHYMFLKRVEKAISLGCKVFDAGLNSLGWKKRWHLKQIPEYKLYK